MMKPTYFKSTFAIAIIFFGFTMNAQNTSLGVVGGTYGKDTATSYTEDPESHAHVKTIVLDKDKADNGGKAANLQAADMADTSVHARRDNVSEEAEGAVDYRDTTNLNYDEAETGSHMDDTCSCNSLHIAYGVAGVGILGTLIFLVLYLNEKSKGNKQDNRA